MTSRDFCYWLQGYLEIQSASGVGLNALNELQVKQIKNHLALVFVHEIDPANAATVPPETAQAVHDGTAKIGGGVGPNGEIYRC
jgi:erythromycin esterase-like protein